MVVLAYLGSRCTKYHAAGWTCRCFMSFYLESCIWRDAISRWIRQRSSECANLGKSATETLAMIRQALGEERMSCKWVFEWHAWFRAGQTSIEDDQHTGRPISCTMPDVEPFKTLLMRWKLVMRHANRF
jgi:hypothetical protein